MNVACGAEPARPAGPAQGADEGVPVPVFERLLARFPDLGLDGDVAWNDRINVRGPAQFPVSTPPVSGSGAGAAGRRPSRAANANEPGTKPEILHVACWLRRYVQADRGEAYVRPDIAVDRLWRMFWRNPGSAGGRAAGVGPARIDRC
jgi:hypothetical protein